MTDIPAPHQETSPKEKGKRMQVLLGLFMAMTLHTSAIMDVHPSGEPFISIECVQCGDWYIPTQEWQTTCPCDYAE